VPLDNAPAIRRRFQREQYSEPRERRGFNKAFRPPVKGRTEQVVIRFAEVICPPEVRRPGRMDATLAEFRLTLQALSPSVRRMLTLLFHALDQGARLYPACRGARMTRASPDAAAGFLAAVLAPGTMTGERTQWLRNLIVMCYYELPEVQQEIGYQPGPYIASVTRRRIERYGAQIRADETTTMDGEPT
jgi:hypothetical protein